jgi:hypothetical protein
VSAAPQGERTSYRRAVLERRPGGLEITLLPPGFFRRLRENFYGGLLTGLAWYVIILLAFLYVFNPHSPASAGEIVTCTVVGSLALVTPFLVAVARARSGGVISVTGDLLTIRRRGLFQSRRWNWKRHELLAIVPGSLWIIDMGERYYIFPERGRDEMAWVADLLSAAFDLDDGPPGSLRVQLLQGSLRKPVPARLHAWSGRLVVYCPDAPWPYFRFLAVPAPLFWQWHKIVAPGKPFFLAPGDASCRVETDGAAKLQLTPSGTRFHLTLHCADGNGLQHALARFWGAAADVS